MYESVKTWERLKDTVVHQFNPAESKKLTEEIKRCMEKDRWIIVKNALSFDHNHLEYIFRNLEQLQDVNSNCRIIFQFNLINNPDLNILQHSNKCLIP